MDKSKLDILDKIPIIGHARAYYYYSTGANNEAKKALFDSSRNGAVVTGAIVGAVHAGIPGTVAGAVAGGASFDCIASYFIKEPEGYLADFQQIYSNYIDGDLDVASFSSLMARALNDMAIGGIGSTGSTVLKNKSATTVGAMASTYIRAYGFQALRAIAQAEKQQQTSFFAKRV